MFARDRPGLLYAVAKTLADLGLTIALSKINTEGTKVADVFYVTDIGGARVDNPTRIEEIRTALYRAVDGKAPASPTNE